MTVVNVVPSHGIPWLWEARWVCCCGQGVFWRCLADPRWDHMTFLAFGVCWEGLFQFPKLKIVNVIVKKSVGTQWLLLQTTPAFNY